MTAAENNSLIHVVSNYSLLKGRDRILSVAAEVFVVMIYLKISNRTHSTKAIQNRERTKKQNKVVKHSECHVENIFICTYNESKLPNSH